jgi:hypothetical protein
MFIRIQSNLDWIGFDSRLQISGAIVDRLKRSYAYLLIELNLHFESLWNCLCVVTALWVRRNWDSDCSLSTILFKVEAFEVVENVFLKVLIEVVLVKLYIFYVIR